MKRRLAAKVVLLIKARNNPAEAAALEAAAAAAGSHDQRQQQAEWIFPLASHQPDESIRETAERALKLAIGPAAVSHDDPAAIRAARCVLSVLHVGAAIWESAIGLFTASFICKHLLQHFS
jgi:hypothetical protein